MLFCQKVSRTKKLAKKVSVDRYEAVGDGSMTALVENAIQYKDYVFSDVEMLDEGHRYLPNVEEDLELIVTILNENLGSSFSDLATANTYSEFAARDMPREKAGTARLMAGWDKYPAYAAKAVGSSELDDEPGLAEGEEEHLESSSDGSGSDSDDGGDDDMGFGDLLASKGENWVKFNPARRGETAKEKLNRCRTLMTRTAIRVQNNQRESRRRRLHATAQSASNTAQALPPQNESSSSDEWEVDKVIGKRNVGTRIEYLIRWDGFDSDEDSWEPTHNLGNAKGQIAKYEKAQK